MRLVGGRRPQGSDWRVVTFSAVVMTMTVYGQTSGVSVFVDPLVRDLGLQRSEVSAAYSAATLLAAFALPWVGRRLDLHGIRPVTLAVAVAFGAVILALALTPGLAWLAAGFFVLRLLGQGSLSLAARTAVAIHFTRHLGRAVAISGSIAAIGMSVIPFVLAGAIATIGWRMTWAVGGLSVWVVLLPLTLWLLPAHASPRPPAAAALDGFRWDRQAAIRTPMFWMITLVNSAVAMILTGFAFHQISVLGEAGASPAAAAANFIPQTVASIAFLAVVAPLAGRWSSRRLLAASMIPLAIGMVAVPFLAYPLVPFVYAFGLGAALGATQALDGVLYPRHFGVHAIGSIRSAAFTVSVASAAAGPLVVGVIHDLTGGYAAAAAVLLVVPMALGAAALRVRNPGPPPLHSATPGR